MARNIADVKKRSILFVYNADSGFLNAVVDYSHKIISPSTYKCNLCAITYGNFGMENDWKQFIKSLKVNVLFLHKDEFKEKYKRGGKFPSAYIKNDDLKLFVSQEEMNSLKNLNELMDLVKKKMRNLQINK